MLEILNISNNKLKDLRKIESLPNLRVVDASNNNIVNLHQELADMFSLDTLYLFGNPVVNSNPQLAKIEGNSS
jgi:Leucine-rich repeat (LRR) protein